VIHFASYLRLQIPLEYDRKMPAKRNLFRYFSIGLQHPVSRTPTSHPVFTLFWISLLLLVFAVGQILTGCWLAFFWRCRDAKRAWQTLRFCLRTRNFNPDVLRSHLGIE